MLDRPQEQRPHAVVIGAGFGGLAAAIRLGARGYRVTVIDKLDAPGGRAYVFRQDGFTFDAGPTVITAPECLTELYEVGGKSMDSGNGYFQGEFISLEAMVKERQRFKDEPGGWAFFRFGEAPNYAQAGARMET